MAREDLIIALRNAIDRGGTLEDGKISLTTAGYSEEDVEDAAREAGIHPELSARAPLSPLAMTKPSRILSEAPTPGQKMQREKKKSEGAKWMDKLVPIFIVVMVLLIGSLLYFYVFKKPAA
jgi:hypothetical protein